MIWLTRSCSTLNSNFLDKQCSMLVWVDHSRYAQQANKHRQPSFSSSAMDACFTRCSATSLFKKPGLPVNLKLPTSTLRASMSTRTDTGNRNYDALLLDAGGTLLQLAKPVEETYAAIGRKYGLNASPGEIKQGFKRAFAAPWPEKLRYQGDGRPFWRLVVSEATGCSNNDYFEEVYEHFAEGGAWHLPSGAHEAMSRMKDAGGYVHRVLPLLSLFYTIANCLGVCIKYIRLIFFIFFLLLTLPDTAVKLSVVSNFDTRLRKLLKDLNIVDLFDAIIISSEVGHEKPSPEIFKAALDGVNVDARKAVHVGDDLRADKMGANAVGIDCWLWGSDIKTFAEIEDRILRS